MNWGYAYIALQIRRVNLLGFEAGRSQFITSGKSAEAVGIVTTQSQKVNHRIVRLLGKRIQRRSSAIDVTWKDAAGAVIRSGSIILFGGGLTRGNIHFEDLRIRNLIGE